MRLRFLDPLYNPQVLSHLLEIVVCDYIYYFPGLQVIE